ncbi:MAG TPA: hypothetical protein VFO38_06585 [Candidatus Saccharimonadales bacterium]|nr:hypothetical protein [Candidatus Saccharimonadales bacterium]
MRVHQVQDFDWGSGKPLSSFKPIKHAHAGAFAHAVAHLWVHDAGGNILFRRRDAQDRVGAGLLDVTLATHIQAPLARQDEPQLRHDAPAIETQALTAIDDSMRSLFGKGICDSVASNAQFVGTTRSLLTVADHEALWVDKTINFTFVVRLGRWSENKREHLTNEDPTQGSDDTRDTADARVFEWIHVNEAERLLTTPPGQTFVERGPWHKEFFLHGFNAVAERVGDTSK